MDARLYRRFAAFGLFVKTRAAWALLRRDVKSGGSYQSQSDLRLHFGLDAASAVDELTVRWPSGTTTTRRGCGPPDPEHPGGP